MSDITLDSPVAPRPAIAGSRDESFRAFYSEQFRNVAGYAFKLTRDEELAHDIAQEAFVRLLVRWIRVREPRAYLFNVVNRLAVDAWRAGVRHRDALARQPLSADTAGPDRTVADAVSRLPRPQREVVLLHYYADLPVVEIAAVVRRPAGTVKWLLACARSRLAETLADDDG